MAYLSKTDFKVARTCPTKLYYKKLGYPSALDEDEYLEFLADGGYMVETIAKLLYPEGREIGFDSGPEASAKETMEALKAENVTLFEATLVSGGNLARVDILKKQGNTFDLIEVKAKSLSSDEGPDFFRGKKGGITPAWQPYLEDVGFQAMVLRELFSKARVRPFLCLVDKSKTTDIDTIFSQFELKPREKNSGKKFNRPEVRFIGDAGKLRQKHFLRVIDVQSEIDELTQEIADSTSIFLGSLKNGISKLPPQIGVICRGCEYRGGETEEDPRSGFTECWGKLALEKPHILDYYHAGRIKSGGVSLIDVLVRKGRAKFADVEESDLVNAKGDVGAVARRQRIQHKYTLLNQEYVSPDLGPLLKSLPYPLHFIDFETSRIAVPYHADMHPYELVAFQWSCHTIPKKGASMQHSEWINLENSYPNFDFASSLMQQISDSGTVFTWSHHENSTLKDIYNQMERYGHEDPALEEWLRGIVKFNPGEKTRINDLCEVAKLHYFHPDMGGRLSIKYVLPAIWRSDESLHTHPDFRDYFGRDETGEILNPYETLKPLPFGNLEEEENEEVIQEGGGAMRAYQEMLYGLSKNDPQVRDQWSKLLLQYCKLDTAAMAIIWTHWISHRKRIH